MGTRPGDEALQAAVMTELGTVLLFEQLATEFPEWTFSLPSWPAGYWCAERHGDDGFAKTHHYLMAPTAARLRQWLEEIGALK